MAGECRCTTAGRCRRRGGAGHRVSQDSSLFEVIWRIRPSIKVMMRLSFDQTGRLTATMMAGFSASLSGTKMYMLIRVGFAPQSRTWTRDAAAANDTVVVRAVKMDDSSMATSVYDGTDDVLALLSLGRYSRCNDESEQLDNLDSNVRDQETIDMTSRSNGCPYHLATRTGQLHLSSAYICPLSRK